MQIELLIGGQRYVLGENDARWLEERIRTTCVDSSHRPSTPTRFHACSSLTSSPTISRPGDGAIELDPSHVRGLTEHVLGGES